MSKAPQDAAPESDAFDGAPHPRDAAALVGHARAERDLLNAYRDERLAHAWLIGGQEGIGKATLAWRFARFILANPVASSANLREAVDLSVDPMAPAMRQVTAMAHPDLALVRRGWNPKSKGFFSEISVADVRSGLTLFQKSAAAGGWRICIVDCAEDLNRNGANALLKMIEEPPPRSLFLIVSHRPGEVLATIRSRCRRLMLDSLTAHEIAQVLAGLGGPWGEIPPQDRKAAAARASGSVREALKRLDPGAAGLGALIDAAMAQLPNADPRAIAKLADSVSAKGARDAFDALTNAIYDWLGARARNAQSPGQREAIATLWDSVRAATAQAEALNLDKRLHTLAIFAEFAAAAVRI